MSAPTRPAPRPDSGFTLIEIAIALVLLSIVLASLGRVSLKMTDASAQSGSILMRNAEMTRQVNRLEALRWDSLPSRAGCVTLSSAPLPHQRCVTVTALQSNRTQVRVIITPTVAPIRPDTVVFERTLVSAINPFGAP
jgi:prepilin-type N-terminal cleavage/methylation domain-containing protein